MTPEYATAAAPALASASGSSPAPESLLGLVRAKLADSGLDQEASAVLLEVLGGGAPTHADVPRAYLRSVTVAGFRGIGRTTPPAPHGGPRPHPGHGPQRLRKVQLRRSRRDSR